MQQGGSGGGCDHTLGTMYMLQGCQSCMRHRSHLHSGNRRATEDVLWLQAPHLNHLFVTCKSTRNQMIRLSCATTLHVLSQEAVVQGLCAYTSTRAVLVRDLHGKVLTGE